MVSFENFVFGGTISFTALYVPILVPVPVWCFYYKCSLFVFCIEVVITFTMMAVCEISTERCSPGLLYWGFLLTMVKWGVCSLTAVSHVTMSLASELGVGVYLGWGSIILNGQVLAGACCWSALVLQNFGFLILGVLVCLRWWVIFLCGFAKNAPRPCIFCLFEGKGCLHLLVKFWALEMVYL